MKLLLPLLLLASYGFGQSPTIKNCYPTVYSVDDYTFLTKHGKKPQPEVKPDYEKGSQGLMEFFHDQELVVPMNDGATKEFVFSFLVNCRGEAGNFELLSKHDEEDIPLSENVLSLCEQIPPKWMPGKVKGRFMDCYQFLKLTCQNGKVVKASLK